MEFMAPIYRTYKSVDRMQFLHLNDTETVPISDTPITQITKKDTCDPQWTLLTLWTPAAVVFVTH
jgi:hypothetical protein